EPVAEALDRLQVMVVGAWTELLLLAEVRHEALDGVGIDRAERLKAAAVDDCANASGDKLDMLLRRAFVAEALLIIVQVLLNCRPPPVAELLLRWIDRCLLPHPRVELRLRRGLFGPGLVGHALSHLLLAVVIDVLVVPRCTLLGLVAPDLEDRRDREVTPVK